MGNSRIYDLSKAKSGGFRHFRLYYLVFASLSFLIWPYTGLSTWHLVFFIGLCFSLYFSYSRNSLPLVVYFSFMFLYWVIAPLFQQNIGVRYYTSQEFIPQLSPMALAFTITHLVGVLFGFQVGRIPKKDCVSKRVRFSLIGTCLLLFTLFLLISLIGFELITLKRHDQGTGGLANYTIFIRNFVKILPAILLSYFLLEGDKDTSKGVRFIVFFILSVVLLSVSNPINTSRFLSMFGLLVVVLTYAVKSSRVKFLGLMLATSWIYSIFLLSITTVMRFGLDSVHSVSVYKSLRTLEFSSYSVFLDALKVEDLPNANYFMSHLLIIIPRDIWPGKAGSVGIDVAERSGYVYNNVGLNSFFNLFSDFGFLGLFLGSIIFGLAAKNLNPLLATKTFRDRRFMYGIMFTGMTPMFFRGDLSTAMLALYPAMLAYEVTRFVGRSQLGRSGP